MNQSALCLDEADVERLLSGEMGSARTSELEQHLTSCIDCREKLEHRVGDERWWCDTQSSLRTGMLSTQNIGNEEDSPERLLDLLGPTDDPNMLGRIASYEIVGLLGQGGMGAVFKGFDRSLNRFVAIKMLLPHLAASGAARKRFAREGQAVAAVVDDYVMAIHCVDEWQGVPYLVMTYSRGVSLQKRLSDKGPLEVREILRIGMQAAKGLAAAHAQGIIHRDIKPANIFLDQNVERVQLMDFGLARAVDDASLTRSGTLADTPQYMSPEQARAETVDHRSDLFSLGSVLYATCTGHAPFRAESSYSVLRLITDKEPRPIREINPDIPEWLERIVMKLLSKSREDRFNSAELIAALLEGCLAHLQHPTLTPLPKNVSSLLQPASPVFRFRRTGIFVMLTILSSIVLMMLMMQPPETTKRDGSEAANAQQTALNTQPDVPAEEKPVDKDNTINESSSLGITPEELEKQIQLSGRALFYGRMELAMEFKTLWTTKDGKRETITSLGTAKWLQKGGMTRIDSDRMIPDLGSVKLHPDQWSTGIDGERTYSWNRADNFITYGALRPGAIAYAPNLFFWGRSDVAYSQTMFGPNPKIESRTRDGREELDVNVEYPSIKMSVRYHGIAPDRGYLPTSVESRSDDQLLSRIEFKDFFEPRPGVWAAKTILWTSWALQSDLDGSPIVESRSKFVVTRIQLGDEAKLEDAEFKIQLPESSKPKSADAGKVSDKSGTTGI